MEQVKSGGVHIPGGQPGPVSACPLRGSAAALRIQPAVTCGFHPIPSSRSGSRVGFYVNTFQSIAGLEENFHKEMSKVGWVICGARGSGGGRGGELGHSEDGCGRSSPAPACHALSSSSCLDPHC